MQPIPGDISDASDAGGSDNEDVTPCFLLLRPRRELVEPQVQWVDEDDSSDEDYVPSPKNDCDPNSLIEIDAAPFECWPLKKRKR